MGERKLWGGLFTFEDSGEVVELWVVGGELQAQFEHHTGFLAIAIGQGDAQGQRGVMRSRPIGIGPALAQEGLDLVYVGHPTA